MYNCVFHIHRIVEASVAFSVRDHVAWLLDALLKESVSQEQQNQLVENMYVRVYGSFRGQRDDGPPGSLGQINSFSIRPVEDHNEVGLRPSVQCHERTTCDVMVL